jgi:hypothetical protein
MKPDASKLVQQGGVGSAIAYVALTAPTEWLKVLPVVPGGHYLPMVAALGAIVTAGLALFGKKREAVDAPDSSG